MNTKIFVVAAAGVFLIILAVITSSGSLIINDVSDQGIFSTENTQFQVLPIEIELSDISILEVTENAATIEVVFKVSNPNFKSTILQILKYELFENDVRIRISQIGERPTGMLLGSNYFLILHEQPTILKDRMTIKNSGNTPEFWSTLQNNTPQWKIKGEAFFNLSSMTSGGENEVSFELTK